MCQNHSTDASAHAPRQTFSLPQGDEKTRWLRIERLVTRVGTGPQGGSTTIITEVTRPLGNRTGRVAGQRALIALGIGGNQRDSRLSTALDGLIADAQAARVVRCPRSSCGFENAVVPDRVTTCACCGLVLRVNVRSKAA